LFGTAFSYAAAGRLDEREALKAKKIAPEGLSHPENSGVPKDRVVPGHG
jgi:hypothetical protein